jgi:predicted restriction endonuclease
MSRQAERVSAFLGFIRIKKQIAANPDSARTPFTKMWRSFDKKLSKPLPIFLLFLAKVVIGY